MELRILFKKTIINIISSRTQSCKSFSSVSSKTWPPSPGIFTRTADHTLNQFDYPKERNQKLTRESSTVTPKRTSKKIRKDMENLRLCICLSMSLCSNMSMSSRSSSLLPFMINRLIESSWSTLSSKYSTVSLSIVPVSWTSPYRWHQTNFRNDGIIAGWENSSHWCHVYN